MSKRIHFQPGYDPVHFHNMKNTLFLLTAMVPLSLGSQAMADSDSFVEKCPDIQACAKAVSELLGQKYVFDQDVKGRGGATPNVRFDKDTAEILFTQLLYNEGYTRVPLKLPNTYQILRQRDARDLSLPVVKADKTTAPNLPDTWDIYTLSYKATHGEAVDEIARNSRSFMPPNSRIVPIEINGTLLITDSAPNLKKIYEMIRDQDEKPTPDMLKRWEAREKERREERRNMFQSQHAGGPGLGTPSVAPGDPTPKAKGK